MKKLCGLIMMVIVLCLPFTVNAASGSYFVASDAALEKTSLDNVDHKLEKDASGYVYAYLGLSVSSGTVNEYTATVTLKNLSLVKASKADGWTGDVIDNGNGTLTVRLKNTTGVSTSGGTGGGGRHLAVTLMLKADDLAAECSLKLGKLTDSPKCEIVDDVHYGKDGSVVTESEYLKQCNSCKQDGGKYYGSNGQETTKEKYDAECGNPQTGNFLPYFVIIVGIGLAGGVYTLTRKSKIYNV